jgi:hypothetical protein
VKVPWVDEVREARALLEKARQASLDLEQVMVALARAQAGLVEPGYEAWYGQLAERWKLTSPAQPARPALMNARAAMASAAGAVSRLHGRLQDLRQQQRQALSAPELAELLAELDALQARASELAMTHILPKQRGILLTAGAGLLAEALAVLDTERAQGAARPVAAAARLHALPDALAKLMSVVQLEPGEGKAPDEQIELPQALSSPRLDWAQLEAHEQPMRELEARMRELGQRWTERAHELLAEYERVSSHMHDKFG